MQPLRSKYFISITILKTTRNASLINRKWKKYPNLKKKKKKKKNLKSQKSQDVGLVGFKNLADI